MKIAIVEINDWHGECIYSQVKSLKNKAQQITVIAHSKLKKDLEQLNPAIKKLYVDFSKKKADFNSKMGVWWFLYRGSFDKIIFNTAEKKAWKLILMPYPKRTELIGCVHNVQRFYTHKTQQKIGLKLHKILVLSKALVTAIPKNLQHKTHYYYSIHYPKTNETIYKPKNEIWICIPGGIDSRRRDYSFLLDLNLPTNHPLKFILLGKKSTQKDADLSNRLQEKTWIVTFDQHVSQPKFNAYLTQSDYVMSCIHPNVMFYKDYVSSKQSGTHNLAMGFGKTLLLEHGFYKHEDFKDKALFYNLQNLKHFLLTLAPNPVKVDYELGTSQQNYVNFICS